MGSPITLPDAQPDLSTFATKPQEVAFQKYTPPNWAGQKALYTITFVDQGSLQAQFYNPFGAQGSELTPEDIALVNQEAGPVSVIRATTNSTRAGYNAATCMNMFVFDAIKRALHRQYANITQHPVQTGFNISDHVMMQPKELVLEVGMSDAIASYSVAGFTPMWTGNQSKSVSAYQQMEALMVNRQLMTINTRLETYDNMVLREISVEDSDRTYFGGLAMVLNFQQVIVAKISLSYLSARPQTTDDTQKGNVQPEAPAKAVVDQHKIPGSPLIVVPGNIPGNIIIGDVANAAVKVANIPGAGFYTSQIIGTVKGLIP